MAGIFAILSGCHGVEEQAIARAMSVLRGGNPVGFLPELSKREEWQAHREALMAGLVQRAFSGRGGGEGAGAAAFSQRRLQVRIGGTMVTVTLPKVLL